MQALRRNPLHRISSRFLNQVVKTSAYSTKKIYDAGQPTPATHPQLMKEGEITPGITSEEYMQRRKKLLDFLPENSLAIVAAAPTKMMTDVVPYNFRQDADYLYITGCQQPGGVAVLGHDCGLCMFIPEPSLQDVLWQGEVAGVDAALDIFKADLAYPISRLPEMLSRMIESSSIVFHNVKTTTSSYMELEAYRKAVNNCKVKDFSVYTHEARLVKSPAELKLMRDSASIACQDGVFRLKILHSEDPEVIQKRKNALIHTMLYSKLFPDEGMLSAKFEYECRVRGAQRMAFNPVVGGGPNGSVIHYSRNDQKIEDGNLVLMDVGCELHGYVSDLTRTWPPFGKFSPVHILDDHADIDLDVNNVNDNKIRL
ncbi:hypothetical protein KY284_004322 [Solanum tuberosum]|nr:hypothetical protein KY284_004322 [Solanum tuberosum]